MKRGYLTGSHRRFLREKRLSHVARSKTEINENLIREIGALTRGHAVRKQNVRQLSLDSAKKILARAKNITPRKKNNKTFR